MIELMSTVSNSSSNDTTVPAYVGFLALGVSVFGFGSNYLPVKKFETGDGMFFQLMLTCGIWVVGFTVHCIRGFPQMYLLPMLGGFFWSTGNLTVVPIIKSVGIGLGALFWNTILLVLGWSIARFGLFHVKAEVPSNPTLNYVGVALAASSGLFYLFVKNEPTARVADDKERLFPTEEEANIPDDDDIDKIDKVQHAPIVVHSTPFIDSLSPEKKRVLGISLACTAGVIYGFVFTPALYVQDNYDNASQNALDYVFSLYTGILLTSIAYFVIYCIVKKNKPDVYPRVVLPGLVSGIMWGISNSSFFLANNALTQSTTFPIVSSGPSAVSALWGILLYKEIKGVKNLLILAVGFAFVLGGSILCGISK